MKTCVSAGMVAPVAQWIEQVGSNDLVGGSSPSGSTLKPIIILFKASLLIAFKILCVII